LVSVSFENDGGIVRAGKSLCVFVAVFFIICCFYNWKGCLCGLFILFVVFSLDVDVTFHESTRV
jgi:hypothetical protein